MPYDFSTRRKPRFVLPPGACDAHNHVFGPTAKFPYAPERRYTPEDAPKEALTTLHALLGVERAAIVQASCHGKDNRAMLDAIADAPDKRRGVAMVDDGFTDKDYAALDRGGDSAACLWHQESAGRSPRATAICKAWALRTIPRRYIPMRSPSRERLGPSSAPSRWRARSSLSSLGI